jgi:hypothetical protein
MNLLFRVFTRILIASLVLYILYTIFFLIDFGTIGNFIDRIISWSKRHNTQQNDIQMLLWGAILSTALIFFIEWLRRPTISIEHIKDSSIFHFRKIANSAVLWKIKVSYRKSWRNKVLFRYSLNNLKVNFTLYSKDLVGLVKFLGKADGNPNAYEERHIPDCIRGINLTKGESDTFPFVLYHKILERWQLFEVWSAFLPECPQEKVHEHTVDEGFYYLKVAAVADQADGEFWFKVSLQNGDCKIEKLSFFENLKASCISIY